MADERRKASLENQERAALARAKRIAPEQDPALAAFGEDVASYDTQSGAADSSDANVQDWAIAETVRSDMIDETADGLDDTEEEVREMAEELPYDEPLEERVRRKAYEIWQSEGGPHGRADDHWRIAAELVAEDDAARSSLLPFKGEDEDAYPEEAFLQDNLGEFPSLADQGRQIDEQGQAIPRRR